MIDLHVHVLPGLDDGAPNLEVSRAMLTRMAATGFRRLVATPHLIEPLTDAYQIEALAALETVRPVAAELGIAVEPGFEVVLTPGLAARLEAGEMSTLAGSRAVLVELPFVGWPHYAESSLFALQVAGYVPVLAHPERYVDVQMNPDLALAAAARGAVLQLTTASFTGVFGKAAQRSARGMLQGALAQGSLVVLATDAHADGQRLVQVAPGLDWIRKHVPHGDVVVRWATEGVPAALLADARAPVLDLSFFNGTHHQTAVGGAWLSLWRRVLDRA